MKLEIAQQIAVNLQYDNGALKTRTGPPLEEKIEHAKETIHEAIKQATTTDTKRHKAWKKVDKASPEKLEKITNALHKHFKDNITKNNLPANKAQSFSNGLIDIITTTK